MRTTISLILRQMITIMCTSTVSHKDLQLKGLTECGMQEVRTLRRFKGNVG